MQIFRHIFDIDRGYLTIPVSTTQTYTGEWKSHYHIDIVHFIIYELITILSIGYLKVHTSNARLVAIWTPIRLEFDY
jgi:hypothetical protein